MKNNFIKQKINTQNKPKTSPSKRNRVLAYFLLAFMIFWTISGVLGVVSFFKNDNVKTAHADSVYDTYRDSAYIDNSFGFFYKHFKFDGQPNDNFASPFKLTINTDLSSSLTIFLRFNNSDYVSPAQLGLFINGIFRTSPPFQRELVAGVTYYKVYLPYSLMNDITSLYNGVFSITALSYEFDLVYSYDFSMFITRNNDPVYQPLFFEGFLDSDNYELGYSEALKQSDFSEFFNGNGTFNYGLGSQDYSLSFVPTELSDYFSSGVFLFSKYLLDTINYNIDSFTGALLTFRFNKPLTISPSYYLSTAIYGIYSQDQFLGLTLRYYNYAQDTGQRVYAGSSPQVVISTNGDGIIYTNENFYTLNTISNSIVNGQVVSVYGSVEVDTLEISVNADLLKLALNVSNNTINLGFPSGFFNGYQAGLIDGRLSFDGEGIFNKGYNQGKQFADQRYQDGFTDGVNSKEYSFMGLLGAVFDAPIQALTGLFNFEILGMNMMSFFMSILTLAIVIFVVRLML